MENTNQPKSEATPATHNDRQPIGAWITYHFTDMVQPLSGYVSFGEYLEEAETDSYDIDDPEIFYYLTEEELKEKYLTKCDGDEWIVLTIDQYIYQN
jgi:hypothetical protein